MCKKFKYSAGDRFGNWTLVKYNGDSRWIARCSCGIEKLCFIDHLSSGKSTRCRKCYGLYQRTIRFYNKDAWRSWSKMRSRCLNVNDDRYYQYGGRGITICDEWNNFEQFITDMGSRPNRTSLDRIDVDGPYNKENCRWATPKQQMRNLRIHKTNGLGKSITEAAEEVGMLTGTLRARLRRGWSIKQALTTPVNFKCG